MKPNDLYSKFMTNCSKDLIIFIGEHAQTEIIYFLLGKKSLGVNKTGKKRKKKKLNTNTSNNLPILLFIFFSSILFNI